MERLGIFVLIWPIVVVFYRSFIKIFVLSKYKMLIDKMNIDRLLLFMPEITPIRELKNHEQLKKLYKILNLYKYIFWCGLTFILICIIIFTIYSSHKLWFVWIKGFEKIISNYGCKFLSFYWKWWYIRI